MPTKKCHYCHTEKDISFYCYHAENKDKKSNQCRDCKNKAQREYRAKNNNAHTKKYEKTKRGFIMRAYRNMESRIRGIQKKGAHLYIGKELLGRTEFYDWIIKDPTFNKLFDNYVTSGYNRKIVPSIDRIDSNRGYTLDNIQILTLSENSAKTSRNASSKFS